MIGYTVALVVVDARARPRRRPRLDLRGSPPCVLGAGFLAATVGLARNPTPAASMKVFTYSITYVTVLFAALTIDVLVGG